MTNNLDAAMAKIIAAAKQGLHAAGEHVVAQTVPLTPLKDGDLRSSLTVTDHEDGGNPAVVVGSDLVYAARRHEEPAKNYSEPGTGFKYLERGANAAAPDVEALIGGVIKRAMP